MAMFLFILVIINVMEVKNNCCLQLTVQATPSRLVIQSVFLLRH